MATKEDTARVVVSDGPLLGMVFPDLLSATRAAVKAGCSITALLLREVSQEQLRDARNRYAERLESRGGALSWDQGDQTETLRPLVAGDTSRRPLRGYGASGWLFISVHLDHGPREGPGGWQRVRVFLR